MRAKQATSFAMQNTSPPPPTVVVPFEPLSFSLRGNARKWVFGNPVKYRKRVQMPRALD